MSYGSLYASRYTMNIMRNFTPHLCLWIITALFAPPALAEDAELARKMRALDEQTQKLKREVLELGRSLANLAWVGGVKPGSDPSDKNARFNLKTLSDETVRMGQSLTSLEDGALAPPGIQLVVFASLDAGESFELREITLNIDNKLVARRSYLPEEVAALRQGGAHRLYIGSLPEGTYQITGSVMFGTKSPQTTTFLTPVVKTANRKTLEVHVLNFLGGTSVSTKEWD